MTIEDLYLKLKAEEDINSNINSIIKKNALLSPESAYDINPAFTNLDINQTLMKPVPESATLATAPNPVTNNLATTAVTEGAKVAAGAGVSALFGSTALGPVGLGLQGAGLLASLWQGYNADERAKELLAYQKEQDRKAWDFKNDQTAEEKRRYLRQLLNNMGV